MLAFRVWTQRVVFGAMVAVAGLMLAPASWAQSTTTGAIAGTVTDANGAAIPGAAATLISAATGAKHDTSSQINGGFALPALEPGTYTLMIEKQGFTTYKQTGILVANGQTITVPVKLAVGASTQTVEVTGEAPLIAPDNANTSTALTATDLENFPMPGNNLLAVAQIQPGGSIKGGLDGFSGISNSTGYFMDGASENDPEQAESLAGATNMLLGENDVAEVTVNTTAYAVDQGRYGGELISYTSKSGGNQVHGNMDEQWNGRVLNAYQYFQKAQPGVTPPKSDDVVNNYQASIGGPIFKNKLFIFYDTEGNFITQPTTLAVSFPTQAYESYVQQQMGLGGYETSVSYLQNPSASWNATTNPYKCLPASAPNVSGGVQPCGAQPSTVNQWPFTSFYYAPSLYGTNRSQSQGTYVMQPAPTTGCTLLGTNQGGSATTPTIDTQYNPQAQSTGTSGANQMQNADDAGCMSSGTDYSSAHTWEGVNYWRFDWDRNNKDTYWARFGTDRGLQDTGASPVNTLFNATSWQPSWYISSDWTHVFSTTLVNDLNVNASWYQAIFGHSQLSAIDNLLPYSAGVSVPWCTSISAQSGTCPTPAAPEGRAVTAWGAFDNLTWTRGAHTLKFGVNWLKDDTDDTIFSPQPSETTTSLPDYSFGYATSATATYPVSTEQPFRLFNLDLFAGDTWQIRRNVTLIYGVRASHQSNEKDLQDVLGIISPFETMSHSLSAPYSTIDHPGQNDWQSVPFAEWQPRFAVTWQARNNTLLKVGWGLFATATTSGGGTALASNAPFGPSFTAGYGTGNQGQASGTNGCPFNPLAISTPICGILADPSQAQSAVTAVNSADSLFNTNYNSGAPACTFYQATGTAAPTNAAGSQLCVPAQSFTIYEPQEKLPYLEEYSASVTQQFGRQSALTVGYVGTKAMENSQSFDPLAFQTACSGCYAPFTYIAGANTANDNGIYLDADPRFSSLTQTYYDRPVWTRYNGLQVTLVERPVHGISFNMNYTLAKTMTDIAEPCLGCIPLAPGHVPSGIVDALDGSWTLTLPFHASGDWMGRLVNDWQLSGAIYEEAGANIAPSSATSPASPFLQLGAGGTDPAIRMPNTPVYAKGIYFAPCPASNKSCGSISTLPDRVQWFYPGAYANNYDSTNKACYNPLTNQDIAFNTTCAQFGYNFGIPGQCAPECELKGPGFSWQNMFITKMMTIREGVKFRFDAQFYNLLNHSNMGSATSPAALFIPGTSSTAGLNSSQYQAGAISATTGNGSLLGSGGTDNGRMIAFQGKITF